MLYLSRVVSKWEAQEKSLGLIRLPQQHVHHSVLTQSQMLLFFCLFCLLGLSNNQTVHRPSSLLMGLRDHGILPREHLPEVSVSPARDKTGHRGKSRMSTTDSVVTHRIILPRSLIRLSFSLFHTTHSNSASKTTDFHAADLKRDSLAPYASSRCAVKRQIQMCI